MISTTLLALAPFAPLQDPVPVREVLAVEPLGERRRSPVFTDALTAALVRGDFTPPFEGDRLVAADGTARTWRRVEAGDDGGFAGAAFRGGWAWTTVEVPASGAWRLDLRGPSSVYVDGAPRAGDVYGLGLTRIPLHLAAGEHELLFRCGRGRLRATLEPAPAPVYLEERDRTLPDVVRGEHAGTELLAGIVVACADARPAAGLVVRADVAGASAETRLPALHPSSYRKCAVRLAVPDELPADADELPVTLVLRDAAGEELHRSEFRLRVRSADVTHKRTFESAIDGSVQYFAVTPPASSGADGEAAGDRPALALSLHGASVEALRQAECYRPKPDCVVVAPTNRRPFGFDWEDQGRLDALEVLALARELFDTDPRRTWLTGHSMGGHGTWQLGAHFPDRFAAIAPSAGWRDFWNYAGAGEFPADDPVGALLSRAANPSRTLLLARNYLMSGVYVLHGDRDATVSVDEARAMRTELATFHPNFAYYERPGAGHWWGNQCMDWPPLFDFLRQNVAPEPASVRTVDFTTVDPVISDACHWVRVEAQARVRVPSRVVARLDADARRVELELENVARLALVGLPLEPGADVRVRIDGDELAAPFPAAGTEVHLAYDDGAWRLGRPEPPRRAGPFKQAFQNRMVFVYGTCGTPEENAWAASKARFDHETWRYRGNGAVDVVADTDFVPAAFAERNVILYGNRDTNAAWALVLADPPFDLARGALAVGGRTLEGDDLALLAVHARRDAKHAAVGVVGGTGLPGARVTDSLPYFVSGVAYPDWTVIGAELPAVGLAGVRGAGFFGGGGTEAESAWREEGE